MEKRIRDYVKYTLVELENYTKLEESYVKKVTSNTHISFPPHGLGNIHETLLKIFSKKKIGFFDPKLQDQVLDNKGIIHFNSVYSHIDIQADFYIFQPTIGSIVKGVIKHVSDRQIGVIIYRVFSVAIKLKEKTKRKLEINSEIEIRIKNFDLENLLPYIEGELILPKKISGNRFNENLNQTPIEKCESIHLSSDSSDEEMDQFRNKALCPAVNLNESSDEDDSEDEGDTQINRYKNHAVLNESQQIAHKAVPNSEMTGKTTFEISSSDDMTSDENTARVQSNKKNLVNLSATSKHESENTTGSDTDDEDEGDDRSHTVTALHKNLDRNAKKVFDLIDTAKIRFFIFSNQYIVSDDVPLTKVRRAILSSINSNKQEYDMKTMSIKRSAERSSTSEHDESSNKRPRDRRCSVPDDKRQDKDAVISVVQQYQQVSHILGTSYGNTVQRLQLNFTPKCCMDMFFCHTHHSKKCPRPNIADSSQSLKAKHFVIQNRPLHFLKFTEDIGIRTKFPGEDILSYILELILLIKPQMYATYTAKYVLQESIVIFDNILTKFPPCWHDLKESYRKVLLNPVNKDKFLSSENIFEFITTKIQKTILEENSTSRDDARNNQDDDDSDNEDDDVDDANFFNFYMWQAKNCPKESLDNHSRSEKLDRLFIVLHLLTKILELDLSIWMLRYMTKTSQHMFGDKRPLVASLFFKDIYSQKSELTKKVISIFVDCCRLKFPQDKTEIISRLLAVLSNTINLCEKNNMDKIEFPFIGNSTRELSMEIHRIIASTIRTECSRSKWIISNISIFISVIKELRIPFIKFIFIDELICKINFEFTGEKSTVREAIGTPITVKKILENLTTNVWIQFVKQSSISLVSEEQSSSKYPDGITHSVGEKESTSISRETYLNLLLDCLKSYCSYYQIKDIVSIFMNREEKDIKMRRPHAGSIKKFNLSLTEKDIGDLEQSLNFKQKRRTPILERPIFDGIHVDDSVMLRYRTDIKYLMILQKQLPNLIEEHGRIFNDWSNFVNDIFKKD